MKAGPVLRVVALGLLIPATVWVVGYFVVVPRLQAAQAQEQAEQAEQSGANRPGRLPPPLVEVDVRRGAMVPSDPKVVSSSPRRRKPRTRTETPKTDASSSMESSAPPAAPVAPPPVDTGPETIPLESGAGDSPPPSEGPSD